MGEETEIEKTDKETLSEREVFENEVTKLHVGEIYKPDSAYVRQIGLTHILAVHNGWLYCFLNTRVFVPKLGV